MKRAKCGSRQGSREYKVCQTSARGKARQSAGLRRNQHLRQNQRGVPINSVSQQNQRGVPINSVSQRNQHGAPINKHSAARRQKAQRYNLQNESYMDIRTAGRPPIGAPPFLCSVFLRCFIRFVLFGFGSIRLFRGVLRKQLRHSFQPLLRKILPQRRKPAVCQFVVMDCHFLSLPV